MAHTIDKPMKKPRYAVQIGARGRLVLPAEVRKRLDLNEGDTYVLSLEPDGSMRLVSLREQIRNTQGILKDLAPGVDLAEELMRDRREEARREDES